MIELKRLKLINWHNFENTTFDCARLTYMIGVNAVGKTTILDAIRWAIRKAAAPCKALSTPSSAAKTPTAARDIPWRILGRSSGTA